MKFWWKAIRRRLVSPRFKQNSRIARDLIERIRETVQKSPPRITVNSEV